MSQTIAALLMAALLTGCGTYRITYRFPTKQPMADTRVIRKHHAHGIGIGGGGYFFAIHQMLPALIDYTGEQHVADICPNGVYEVSHHTKFWHNAAAAFTSWLVVLNVYHPSEVIWTCVKAAPPTAPESIPGPSAARAR